MPYAPERMDSVVTRIGLAFAGLASAVSVGALLYLLVSFFALRRYAAARPWRRTLGSLLREAVAIAVTQPMIPFFYLLGRRMGGAGAGRPIVFVHGYFQNRADFLYLASATRRAGLGPLYGFNYSWLASIPACAERLGAFVETVCAETGRSKVAIVGHSLGGLVALEYLGTEAGSARVERCVTIASPHAGVQWRGGMLGRAAKQLYAKSEYMRSRPVSAFPVPVMSIFSTHDNIVHPATTSALVLRGGEDVAVDDIGHLGMLFSRQVAALTVRALEAPTPIEGAAVVGAPIDASPSG